MHDVLNQVLENERRRIRSSYPSGDVIFPLIEIIRTLDYHTFIFPAKATESNNSLQFERYRFGWSLAFQQYYSDLVLDDNIPIFSYESKDREWVDQIVQHAGSIQITSQLLALYKADLLKLSSSDNKAFHFNHIFNSEGGEFYERLSTDYYFSLVDGVLAEKKKGFIDRIPEMQIKLQNIVQLVHGKFISYAATDEFDEFYSQLGYLYLMTSQVVDDFDESDMFGGITWKTYMDHVEFVHRAALMHRDCCMALAEKTAYKVNIRDILTYGFLLSKFSKSLGEYLEVQPDVLRKVISCLTINKENFQHHLPYPGASSPPYFQVGNDTLMRSIYGCIDKPVLFLIRELKRKFPTDFFNAVNRREARFKKELYNLFKQEQIIKIDENVIIKTNIGDTDIDAILYDKKRNTLGLFQLKWQDSFSTSMKERFSRITNLIPKSVEWIDKVSAWLKSNDEKTIFETLRLSQDGKKIESIYLFVIARHHVHFTNQKLDDRAIWSSWFQVLECSAKIKDPTNANPIAEFAAKLQFFSPGLRSQRESLPRPAEFELMFSNYKVTVKS